MTTATMDADDTACMLGEIRRRVDRFSQLPDEASSIAVTLWIAHTHAYRSFYHTPRLGIFSPLPESGKTRLLKLIKHLVPGPLFGVDTSLEVLYTAASHTESATLLMDEVDSLFGRTGSVNANRRMVSVLNAGYERDGYVSRMRGGTRVDYPVYMPVAMTGQGFLRNDLRSRCIEIAMVAARGMPDFDERAFGAFAGTAQETHAWAARNEDGLLTRIELPEGRRATDIWRPLLTIAHGAGSEWRDMAMAAWEALTDTEAPIVVSTLLTDIRMIIGSSESIFSIDLMDGLQALPAWTALDRRQLGDRLDALGINSVPVRIGTEQLRGYRKTDFASAWGELG